MPIKKVIADDVTPNRKRGGDIRVLLSPLSVGATSGFMGLATLAAGERVREHRHPYSEEFIYVTGGAVMVMAGDEEIEVRAGEAVMIPKDTRHKLRNAGSEPATAVFHSSPLAPRPDLGHVDLEPPIGGHEDVRVGGPGARS